MNKKSYYMITTSVDDFKVDIKNKLSIIGLPDRNEKSIRKFDIGDKIIFYISKLSLFGGIAEVVSQYFYDRKQIWTDPYDLWPHRVFTKPIYLIDDFTKMIFVKDIWEELEFIKKKKKWGVYVQGSFKRLSEHDFEVVLRSFKKNT